MSEDAIIIVLGIALVVAIAWGRWHFRNYGKDQ